MGTPVTLTVTYTSESAGIVWCHINLTIIIIIIIVDSIPAAGM